MEWLNIYPLFTIKFGLDFWLWFILYFIIGFIVAKIFWYLELVRYRQAFEGCQRSFLQSRNISSGTIPENLRTEWSEFFHQKALVKPEPGVIMEALFWPLLVLAKALYLFLILPVKKSIEYFSGLNAWIERRALGDLGDHLPIRPQKENYKEAIDSFRKTIGPNGKD